MYRRLLALFLFFGMLPLSAFARTANDPLLSQEWYLSQIHAEDAWDTTAGNNDIIVAVLDTGVDATHPDLVNNIWTNGKEIAGNGVDDDRNGYVDDVHGWDFIDGDNNPSPDIHDGGDGAADHGTLIAGIIDATGNDGIGVAGIAWHVKIMPVRMLDAVGGGDGATAASAIRYAVKNGAKVINMSFVGDTTHAALENAVEEAYNAGVVVVAALGNSAQNTDTSPVYPACMRDGANDWVLGVSATGKLDEQTSFTNYGKTCADLSAPGVDIFGARNTTSIGASSDYLGGWDGTSTASPMVAGAAALLFSAYPTLTPTDVRTIIKLSVDPLSGMLAGKLGVGRLNVANALRVAESLYGAPRAESTTGVTTTEPSTPGTTEPGKLPSGTPDTSYLTGAYAAFGAPKGSSPRVEIYTAEGKPYASFDAYAPAFTGGVNVALGAFTAFRGADVVTGAGDGGGPHVRVFTAYGAVAHEFFAYDSASRHGVFVAAGDVDADGVDDIVTSVGAGVSNDVKVFDGEGSEKLHFTADVFGSASLAVALVDFDDDWNKEFAVYPKDGGVEQIALYDDTGAYITTISPFTDGRAAPFTVAGDDVNADGVQEILVASTADVAPDVRAFTKSGALMKVFTPFASKVGARIATNDVDVDGEDDVLAMEDAAGGAVTLLTRDGQVLRSAWTAPLFPGGGVPSIATW